METRQWLRELGAVRPMAPVGDEELVLGKWCDGVYPIKWKLWIEDRRGIKLPKKTEMWYLFGHAVLVSLTKEDCERILKQLKDEI